jgi:protein-disulfide isomerase
MAEEIKTKTEGKKLNPWILSTIVLAALVITMTFFMIKGGITGNVVALSENTVAAKGVEFLNTYVTQSNDVTLSSVKKISGMYLVTVDYKEQEIPVYMTIDGKYIDFGQGMIDIEQAEASTAAQAEEETPTEVPKTAKANLELFIMTHCPYGTQSEKALIPAYNLLKNKADITVRFVHYFMHGDVEEQETYNQLCIREEQPAKFWDYLSCFLEAGDTESCLTKVGVDKTKLSTCLTTKAKEYYAADSVLSNQYGVQGSPTFILNGVQASVSRSPDAVKSAICSAFTTSPSECSQTLSTAQASAGFGTDGSTASGSC